MRMPAAISRVRRTAIAAGLTLAAVAALPAAASAASSAVSSNWAGYAVNGKFKRVSATWTQPAAACRAGRPTFSAVWVGLGGLNRGSQALEQAGSEADCGTGGHAHYSAWYELVPANPVSVRLSVHPGDRITTTVTVRGGTVHILLVNGTRHKTYRRTLRMSGPDITSAEWIVEAPSACDRFSCQPLPLTNFGTVQFSGSSATATGGGTHAISYATWSPIAIRLQSAPPPGPFAASSGSATAVPSALSGDGSAFSVRYSENALSQSSVTHRLYPLGSQAGR